MFVTKWRKKNKECVHFSFYRTMNCCILQMFYIFENINMVMLNKNIFYTANILYIWIVAYCKYSIYWKLSYCKYSIYFRISTYLDPDLYGCIHTMNTLRKKLPNSYLNPNCCSLCNAHNDMERLFFPVPPRKLYEVRLMPRLVCKTTTTWIPFVMTFSLSFKQNRKEIIISSTPVWLYCSPFSLNAATGFLTTNKPALSTLGRVFVNSFDVGLIDTFSSSKLILKNKNRYVGTCTPLTLT